MASTLTEYINSQEELVREAAEALPHQFSQCTYSLGRIRQAVYLCLTCSEARGLCSACSIACHTDHEQVELFPKRNFRCDCPTTAIAHRCSLHPKLEDVNISNSYGQNFKGLFCRCRRTYDPNKEREAMIQCLACEDWFHESCCNLREKPSSRESTPIPPDSVLPSVQPENGVAEAVDDAASEASSSGLPPPLISADDYESFICSECVARNPTLMRWAGTHGVLMVGRDSPSHPWRLLEGPWNRTEGENVQVDGDEPAVKLGMKRPSTATDRDDAAGAKRHRRSTDADPSQSPVPCLASPQNPLALKILANLSSSERNTSLGTGDIFLVDGFRERWCRCSSCLPPLESNSYLLNDEETYEPPRDPDSALSLEELGMRALSRIPRDKAIEGIHAFNEMKDDLVKFLRPFAQNGKVVNESDVKEFFASLSEGRKVLQTDSSG